jgi:hypothetical protein
LRVRGRKEDAGRYDSFVEHPRYGRGPRYTNSNPSPYDPEVQLHWNATNIGEIEKRTTRMLGHKFGFITRWRHASHEELHRISWTAIEADPSRQNAPTVPVTHYFDLERKCRKCNRPFIFFALEQKHWYEELGFPLDADCVHCPECRKKEQSLARKRRQYERLIKLQKRDGKDNFKLAECAVSLIEEGVFGPNVAQRAKAALRFVPEGMRDQDYQSLLGRVNQWLKAAK